MTVLTTAVFDSFMRRNNLYEAISEDLSDEQIARCFLQADFPAEYTGDLMALITTVKTPLAIRSSSLLEDAMFRPFAGVYGTKMIPNNESESRIRFRKLVEAVKFVYASTFFAEARSYIERAGQTIDNEKMAVIIQEVLGRRHFDRFYPNLSAVARSYNYYPTGRSKPADGVVDLALGLGKTIVDGGIVWTYSPAWPKISPPFGSTAALLKGTQTMYWAVDMGKLTGFDPIRESEYLIHLSLEDAETDGSFRYIASTYDLASDRVNPGIGMPGPRIINFAPLLVLKEIPFNDIICELLRAFDEELGTAVEIELAMTFDSREPTPARLGFLQVRPMVVSEEKIDVTNDLWGSADLLAKSERVLGNGRQTEVHDVVFVKPERFEARFTPKIAAELDEINRRLLKEGRRCLFIGFGRWGSSDPWLGIPVNWSQISTARAIVEAMLPDMDVELSQGSHFFHNISSFQVSYFSVSHTGRGGVINWDWLNTQPVIVEAEHVKHVRLVSPLTILVDGRIGKGVILHG